MAPDLELQQQSNDDSTGSPPQGQTQSSINRVYIRVATAADVAHVRELILGLVQHHDMLDHCDLTEQRLHSALYGDPTRKPFQGPTVILAEVGWAPEAETCSVQEPSNVDATSACVGEEQHDVAKGGQVQDPDSAHFVSALNSGRTVVGFALAYPNFSTFIGLPGLWLEDIFVRDPYRSFGIGTKLLRFLARVAHQKGMGRLDWSVMKWNTRAIDFYTQRMGAELVEDIRICRLEGKGLEAVALSDD